MQQMDIFFVRQHSEDITSFRANMKYLFIAPVELSSGGLYIDVDSNANSVVSRIGNKDSEKQYMITSANSEKYKEKLNLSSSVKDEIRNAVNGGTVVTVDSEEIKLGDWSGTGYIVMDPKTGSEGYMISGGIAGEH